MAMFNDSQWPLLYVKLGSEPLTHQSFRKLLMDCSMYETKGELYRLVLDMLDVPSVPFSFIMPNISIIMKTQLAATQLDAVLLIVPESMYPLCKGALQLIPSKIPISVVKTRKEANAQKAFLNMETIGLELIGASKTEGVLQNVAANK